MKKNGQLILLILLATAALGQKLPIQVKHSGDPHTSCGKATLGSGFEKAGMVQYVARPRIIDSKWHDTQLTIKVFVVSECCPPDYLGYLAKSDTLVLYYGNEKHLPTKAGAPEEVEICLCGTSGCCYEFEYNVNGLNRNTNYIVAVSDVLDIGFREAYAIGYINGKHKSIRYSNLCESLEVTK